MCSAKVSTTASPGTSAEAESPGAPSSGILPGVGQRFLEAHRLTLGPGPLEGIIAELPGGRLARMLVGEERVGARPLPLPRQAASGRVQGCSRNLLTLARMSGDIRGRCEERIDDRMLEVSGQLTISPATGGAVSPGGTFCWSALRHGANKLPLAGGLAGPARVLPSVTPEIRPLRDAWTPPGGVVLGRLQGGPRRSRLGRSTRPRKRRRL